MPENPRIRIEPLDAAKHDRASFSSGVLQCDNFIRLTAGKLTRAGHIRTFVMTPDGQTIIGYYAVNAHSISYTELPLQFARDRPASGAIPVAFIAMIAVDATVQGMGYGGDLLSDALKRIAEARRSLGVSIAMLDVLDDGHAVAVARRLALYRSYGFKALDKHPLRMWVSVKGV
jgi:ribosomal protein S18 acetylase RimI-like enzyme